MHFCTTTTKWAFTRYTLLLITNWLIILSPQMHYKYKRLHLHWSGRLQNLWRFLYVLGSIMGFLLAFHWEETFNMHPSINSNDTVSLSIPEQFLWVFHSQRDHSYHYDHSGLLLLLLPLTFLPWNTKQLSTHTEEEYRCRPCQKVSVHPWNLGNHIA